MKTTDNPEIDRLAADSQKEQTKGPRRGYWTQWAGQYGVAYELTLRGHLVAFTMGNAPARDLLCHSPRGVPFSVQVKSARTKSPFLYQPSLLRPKPSLFLVFVLLPTALDKRPEYHVLTNNQFQQVVKEQDQRYREAERRRRKRYAKFPPTIDYRTLAAHDNFRDAFGSLPE